MSTLHVLYDADQALYAVGSVMEFGGYFINNKKFKLKKEAVAYCDKNNLNVADITSPKLIPTFNAVLSGVRNFLQSKANVAVELYLNASEQFVEDIEITYFLTGSLNFRNAITDDYKANRADIVRPIHHHELKAFMVENWDAVIIDGLEADDVVAMEANKLEEKGEQYLVIALDKDLNCIPGWHFDPNKKDVYFINQKQAEFNFFNQLLVGDIVDNIKGVKGIGPVKSDKILTGKNKEERWEAVKETYAKAYPEDWKEKLEKCVELIHLRRSPNQTGLQYYNLEI